MNDFLKIDWLFRKVESYPTKFLENIDNLDLFEDDEENDKIELKNIIPTQEHIPGLMYFNDNKTLSTLNETEQSTCLRALELYQSGRPNLSQQEQMTISYYLRYKEKIIKENERFLNYVKDQWKSEHKQLKIKSKLKNFGWYSWKKKLNTIKNYVQFYREFDTLPFSYDGNKETIEMIQIENLLELGTVAKYLQPQLTMRTVFNIGSLPEITSRDVYSKLAVSMDKNVESILEQNPQIDIVMSSGSLTKFINYCESNDSWDLPVLIKMSKNESNTKEKKVVYLDKPLPTKNINLTDVNNYAHKILLKTNCCKYEEFSFPNVEASINKENDEKTCTFVENTVETTEQKINSKNNLSKTNGKRKIHHNVSYRLWNLHIKIEENDPMKFKYKYKAFNVLIRTKLDACEISEDGSFVPINLFPKLENQLKYGANISTTSELAKQWVLLSSRPFSKLYRVRFHQKTSEVITIENCTLQKINNEALLHNYKPHSGLGILYKTLIELQNYDAGNYLLRYVPKKGPFILILKECEKDAPFVYDLYEDYENNSSFTPEMNKFWCPIDVNFILPAHKYCRRLPGLFKPKKFNKVNLRKGKKKWKKGLKKNKCLKKTD